MSRSLSTLKDQLRLGLILIDEAITELADQDRADDIAALITARLRFEPSDVSDILLAGPEAPTALLCKAAGVKLNGFSAILRMRHRRGLETGEPAAQLRAYQRDLESAGLVQAIEPTSRRTN